MNVNKIVNTLGKALAGRPTKNKSSKRNNRRRNRNRRIRGRKNGRTLRAMPAAYAAHVRPRFTILSRSNRHCVVSGCDLIYKIPATLTSNGDALFSIITANPAYWKGTRIGRIAPAYQTYRPIFFKISYIPQVAVTQPGTVFMGTLWDMAPPLDNLQQSLLTSNGGQMTQCYIPADSTVALGRNLQQNLFKMSGALSTDTNPFLFCVGVAGADVIPGYIYVTYKYELRNPIGDSWTFINSGITNVGELPEQSATANGTVILLNSNGQLGPGTILDRESGATTFLYHGSPVELDAQTQVYYLNNFQTSTLVSNRSKIELGQVDIDGFELDTSPENRTFADFKKGPLVSLESSNYVLVTKDKTNGQYAIADFSGTDDYTDSRYDIWYLQVSSNSAITLLNGNDAVMTLPHSDTLILTKLPLTYGILGLPN